MNHRKTDLGQPLHRGRYGWRTAPQTLGQTDLLAGELSNGAWIGVDTNSQDHRSSFLRLIRLKGGQRFERADKHAVDQLFSCIGTMRRPWSGNQISSCTPG